MNFKISQRKAFLTEQKNKGQRITIGFTGIADLRSFIALEYIEGMMKAAADYVTASVDEDGILLALKHLSII